MKPRMLIESASPGDRGRPKPRRCLPCAVHFLAAFMLLAGGQVQAAEPMLLELEAKIPLGNVQGRIDHMAVDLGRKRLFVAELGNDSLGVVDLEKRAVLRTIAGLSEPQGVGYLAATDTVYVANGGDGSVRLFAGADLSPVGSIALDSDADNVRTDEAAAQVYVGHSAGGIAVIDASRHLVGDFPLPAHPEGFQLDPGARRIYVNLPDFAQIAVIDVAATKMTASWSTTAWRANFPLALDRAGGRVFVAARHPPQLVEIAAATGTIAAHAELCGDADDVFFDPKRSRVYASCGEGVVEIFAAEGTPLRRIGRVPTVAGARTALWVPAFDCLYVAVRAADGEAPAIWVYRPAP